MLHTVRVQSNSDEAYHCVYEAQDTENHRGVQLSKDIVKVAGKCMEKNMTTIIGPYVLPLALLVEKWCCYFFRSLVDDTTINRVWLRLDMNINDN